MRLVRNWRKGEGAGGTRRREIRGKGKVHSGLTGVFDWVYNIKGVMGAGPGDGFGLVCLFNIKKGPFVVVSITIRTKDVIAAKWRGFLCQLTKAIPRTKHDKSE